MREGRAGDRAFWLEPHPLVLASGSGTRLALLEAAGLPVEVKPPDIDERAIERRESIRGADAIAIACALARAKASSQAIFLPHRLVLGADQTLALHDQLFHKPPDPEAAAAQIKALSGRQHQLHSAISLWRNQTEIFSVTATAIMTMRTLSDEFIENYVAACGEKILRCVGGYQLEGLGIQLFEEVAGDHTTVLGLPLFPLLSFLRHHGSLAS